MRRDKGFTLIELLIVVAIIAILALIAVPNFLEAQVRSKVSRAKADMRSIATGLEAYRVDWNNYLPCGSRWQDPPGNPDYWQLTPPLSTPVAYISNPRSLKDPFRNMFLGPGEHYRTFRYVNTFEHWGTIDSAFYPILMNRYQGSWMLISHGPNQALCTWGGTATPPFGEECSYAPEYGYPVYPIPYDPTNGTVSGGDLMRTERDPDGKKVG